MLALQLDAIGPYGLMAGVIFFLVLAAAAFIAFKMMKRTVKMAVRMAVVALILVIAVVGSIGFWALGSGSSKPKATPTRSR